MYVSREFDAHHDRLKASWHGFLQGCIQLVTILLIFTFQQAVLYYTVYYVRNERRVLYVLGLDAFIAFYLLAGTISTRGLSSARISIQWCLCCSSTAIKLAALLFLPSKVDSATSAGFNRVASEDYLSFFGIYLTPLIYVLFNRLSNRFLFDQEKENVNVDELLHSDLALATAVDLWDVVLMVNHLIRRYRGIYESNDDSVAVVKENRDFVAFAVLCVAGLLLLGLISPTVDGDLSAEDDVLQRRRLFWANLMDRLRLFRRQRRDAADFRDEIRSHDVGLEHREAPATPDPNAYKTNQVPKGQYIDMFSIAKFTFLVGFGLIDLPFFVYRLMHMIRENVFSLLMYKNLLGLVVRPYRLMLSQLAERDSAKGWQSAFFEATPVSSDPSTKRVIHEDMKAVEESSDSESEAELVRRLTERATQRRGKTVAFLTHARTQSRLAGNTLSLVPRGETVPHVSRHFRSTHQLHNARQEKLDDGIARANTAAPRPHCQSDDPATTGRASSVSDADSSRPDEPSPSTEASQKRRQVLLGMLRRHRELPVASLGLRLYLRKWRDALRRLFAPEPNFDMDAHDYLVSERRFEFARMLGAVATALLARLVIVIYCYARAADVRSPRFVFSSAISTATTYELLVYGTVLLAPLCQGALFYRLQGCRFFGCLAFSLLEILNLCSYVTCVCSLRGIVDVPYSTVYAMQLCALLQWPLSMLATLAVQALSRKLNLVRLMYVLCKHGMCPVSLNHKLFCLDLLKSLTVADLLMQSQWNYYFYSLLFRVLCCSFSPTKTGVMIILVDLLVRFVYIIFCQTMRVMMLRKFEIHYLILRLTNAVVFDYMPPGEAFSLTAGPRSHFITPADVDDYIRDQGLLSSPGIIFPPFF
ncbi:uncharacterized protein BcabD6B2_35570 [Babesia caballi]|uniref:Transmembrane protein, putative n=1 Tax=Babesia caballi TaxID=5871 RepID=A0AAV4LWU9_BABCB|nr:transmembrane protein, putative [Babesia caballi]